MTRDYKHSRARAQRRTPAWVWLLVGFAMGLVVALLVYLHGQTALQRLEQATNLPHVAAEPAASAQRKPEKSAEPRREFDFYTLLPELEVVIPDETETASAQHTPRARPALAQAAHGYVLQVGSFQRLQEADSLKAKLALLGVEADIQTVRVNQDTWHRVRIGPARNLDRLSRIRARLRANNVDSLLVKAK